MKRLPTNAEAIEILRDRPSGRQLARLGFLYGVPRRWLEPKRVYCARIIAVIEGKPDPGMFGVILALIKTP